MITKSKPYKEITLLWPNVARIVKDAESFLDDLVCQDNQTFVEQCAIQAAKKASEIDYTDDYTYRKLTTFCDEFKEGLLDLEKMNIRTKSGEWTPEAGPFGEFVNKNEDYSVSMREKAVRLDKYRALIDAWIKSNV
jgi:hypothetical protein